MTLPFALPDWLPWWVPAIVLVLALLWVLTFLMVPFSVIGLKARLDGLEARLDEIQAEIRTLTLRLPDPVQPVEFDDLYAPPEPPRREPGFARPPIPPAAHEIEDEAEGASNVEPPPPDSPPRSRRTEPRRGSSREPRTEPRLDWPR
jgi:hypothetical protein